MAPITWAIIGASRGIGLEFVKQCLDRGDQVIAAVRNPAAASRLWQIVGGQQTRVGSCVIEQCDVTDEQSIDAFVEKIRTWLRKGIPIDRIVLNAGVLKYPNRATEISYSDFALHLHTNTIGPIVIAQKILNLTATPPPWQVIFISSDSGSAISFRDFEDGFGAYAASKAALNQMLRHMAAELKRKGGRYEQLCVLALHPGEVETDLANVQVDWEISGIISAKESVAGMIKVLESKGKDDSGTFWTWDGRQHPW